jgi:hypothetical protein
MTTGYKLKKIPRTFDLLGFLNGLRDEIQAEALPKLVRLLLADFDWLDTSDYTDQLDWACLCLSKKFESQVLESCLDLYKYRGHYYIIPQCDYGLLDEILSTLNKNTNLDRLSDVVSKRVQIDVWRAVSKQLPISVTLTGTKFFRSKSMEEKLREVVRLELTKKCLACSSDYLGQGLICHSCKTTQNKTGVTRA